MTTIDAATIEEGCESRLKQLLSKAAILVGSPPHQPVSEDVSLEQQLSQRLNDLQLGPAETSNDLSVRAIFVEECMQMLVAIQEALVQEISSADGTQQTDRDYLGVRDLRLVHTLLQVVVSWGMYPCFLPGVGVPLSKRVKSGYTNHELLTKHNGSEDPHTSEQSGRTLLGIATRLTDIIALDEKTMARNHGTTIASILLVRHLPDLYAALLQLAYQPVSTTTTPPTSSQGTTPHQLSPATVGLETIPAASLEQDNTLRPDEKNKCARMFMWLFERSDLYRAMESLMLLLGTSPLHPVPAWLRSICGRFLSRILLKPKGVAVVLDFTVGNMDQVQLAEMEKISKLILSIPKQMTSVESYYAVIAPQLLNLLQSIGPSLTPKDQVVTFIVGRMVTKHTTLAKQCLVEPVVGGLARAWQRTDYGVAADDGMDQVALTDDQVAGMLQTLHNVMIGGDPSPIVIQSFMESSIPALYHLYELTCRMKSNLRGPVLDLLTTYFRIMTTKDALDDLKKIVLDPIDIKGDRIAYFAPSSTGGVVLRLKSQRKGLGGNELPLDATRLIEFLQALENPDLCGDFFVYLLNIYSSSQSASSFTDPKTILMILHLIMGMADTLGPTILGKPTQILSFASSIVMEHIDRIENAQARQQQRQKQQSGFPDITNIVSDEDRDAIEDAHDENFTMEDDLESLLLAVNLVRAVIHESDDQLDRQTVQLLGSILGPLKRLEKYAGDIMQDQIHEVILAITTYLSAYNMKSGKSATDDDALEQSKVKYRDAMKALQDELLPIRAHGMGMLKEMILAKDPLVSSGTQLDGILDLFVRLVQDEDSFIYLNAIKGLAALTDIHGKTIIEKLGSIYSDDNEKLDNRLRVGEALLQTVQRCGDALGKYVNTLIKPLETVLSDRQTAIPLRVSALSLLSTVCQTCPVALSSIVWELTNWVLNILEIEQAPEVRRAGTVLILSLFRGMAQQILYSFPADNLRRAYRTLRYIERADPDELTRHQARVALSDLDVIMRGEIFGST